MAGPFLKIHVSSLGEERDEKGRGKNRGKRGKIIKAVPRKRASVAPVLWFVCFLLFLCCEL